MKTVNKLKIYESSLKIITKLRRNYCRMFKFTYQTGLGTIETNSNDTNFVKLWKTLWDKLHDEGGVFRYKIEQLQEKILDGKYLLQLNPDRRMKRRAPEHIENICQPFDENKFNFTKVSPKEVLFNIERMNDPDKHKLIVNVSPITKYHSLLCPSVDKKFPQVVTEDSIRLVLEIMFVAKDQNLRIGFNSLCAMASVNHLHYHLFLESYDLPVENVKCTNIKGPLFCFEKTYPVPAFCFQITSTQFINDTTKEIYKLIEYLLKNSIAHNIFVTRGSSMVPGDQKEVVRFVIWARKGSAEPKLLTGIYVALCELSGWFPVYTQDDFDNLRTEELLAQLSKWKLDNFDILCEQLSLLY